MQLKDVLVSFITSVDKKKNGQMTRQRKEIALLSIQNVKVDYFSSPEWFDFKAKIGSL